MAFKTKNPSTAKMAKQAGSGSPMKNDPNKGERVAESSSGKSTTSKGTEISIDEFLGINPSERKLREYFDKKFPKSEDPDGIKKHEAMKRYFANKK